MESHDNKKLKILLVGEFMWPWYHEACAKALEHNNCVVRRFGWLNYFWYFDSGKIEPIFRSLLHKFQYRFGLGPVVARVSSDLLSAANQFQPDVVWFYNVTVVPEKTVKKLRFACPNAVFVQYANDNPFSKTAKLWFWRNYLNSVKHFDLHCVFRHCNIIHYKNSGSKNQAWLRAYFIPETEYPESVAVVPNQFKCDVVFAGHFEDDGRIEMLEAVCHAGYKLNLFGGGWAAALPKLSANSPLRSLFPITPVTGANYRYAICGAKVALCFLSKINNDTYTRRNFQIPAMKVAMLSEYTEDLASLFKPDLEATYFNNKIEMIEKLKFLLENDFQRRVIAEAGFARVYADGHDVNTRMQNWLKTVLELMPYK